MDGIDVANVTEWLATHVEGSRPPFEFTLIAGGRSNLTYKVTDTADPANAYVLRRPPLGHVLPTAHDMGREHRVISALGPTAVPVAPAVGFCDDLAVTGAPFYVMRFVEGFICRDAGAAQQLTAEQRRRAGESLVEVLVRIHEIDPTAVGLEGLGRHEGYVERQLNRWYSQFQKSKMRDVPVMDEMYEFLKARIPPQQSVSIVHGDYRLDNCILGADGSVVAVLDWELCTLGDPLADVGLLVVYWNDPDDGMGAVGGGATTVEGFPRRAEIRRLYAELTGRDTSELDFYVSFAYWKLASILDGVYTRYAKGAMGQDGAAWEAFGESVVRLAEMSKHAAASLT